MAPWLSHTMVSRQEAPRPLLTAGEVMQLPGDEALILTGGAPPIRARKVRYCAEPAFRSRLRPPFTFDAPAGPGVATSWNGGPEQVVSAQGQADASPPSRTAPSPTASPAHASPDVSSPSARPVGETARSTDASPGAEGAGDPQQAAQRAFGIGSDFFDTSW